MLIITAACGRPGHGVNRCSQVDNSFPFLPPGWSVTVQDGQYRVVWPSGPMARFQSGNEGWSGREALSSLGVVDLDLSITPDVFGLRAFYEAKPFTRMLTGQYPNELRLLIPDMDIAPQGLHDIAIENLSASQIWRSCHVLPGDVTSLRRRWPKRLFRTLRKRQVEMEQLRRDSCSRPEWKFPGRCSLCQENIVTALEHMMDVHLALGQLWRCPVEWCTVWKGSSSDCLAHVGEKHGGSENVVIDKLEKLFPLNRDPRLLADGSSAGCVWCGGGRPVVP